ncbi:HDOD domain-containing protein [Colwellia sp. MSW7]|uniref:HDOD domain-containing protein n=1 Tax=Colwellia maritima TaxID=2912588 RepID=A0ABS9X427_9GAMM|nr:HDOD domain-containing protein [Colwellia maritima]MCI2284820.1 HDOD domain-containing protein [Colwellia maritima]
MYSYIARQPILNIKQETVAYELLFRDGKSNTFPSINPDQATSKIIVDNQLRLGLEEVTGNLPAYINFHAEALIHRFPSFLDPKKIVVEILEDVAITDELLAVCKSLKQKGYTLALDDYIFDPQWDVFLPYIDILKVDVLELSMLDISRSLSRLKDYKFTLLAEKIETKKVFEQLKLLGFTLFQGYFFAKPEMLRKKNILSSKKHIMDLMEHANRPEFDFDAISEVFSKDVVLTYKLLRFINSPGYGPSKEICSLKHALIYIGDLELKKFIALLVLADLAEGKPDQIIRVSLIRAKFCEKIASIKKIDQNPPTAFLTGMLSHIDGVLDQSITEVMNILPVHKEIKTALIERNNYLAIYLALSLALEQGKWQQAKRIANKIKLMDEEYLNAYQESIHWSDAMLAIT